MTNTAKVPVPVTEQTPRETREHSLPLCPKCSTPLVHSGNTDELECRVCLELLRMKPHAGCPHCGANSYYPLAEGYKCHSCKGEFSEEELTAWIEDLDKVVEGCREDPRWSLHSLTAHPPPFYLHEVAKNRMDYLAGRKTIVQISNPAHCRDNLIKHYPHAPNAFGDLTLERASETLSKALVFAYTGQREPVIFRRQGKSFYISVKGKEFPGLKPLVGFECISFLLLNPGSEIEAPQIVKFCSDLNEAGAEKLQEQPFSDLTPGGVEEDFIVDKDARKAVAKEIKRLKSELEAAPDPDSRSKIEDELDKLEQYRKSVIGLFGKPREFSKDQARLQQRVSKNIKDALDYLYDCEGELANLADHLDHRIKRGKFFSYEPDPNNPINWVLQKIS